MKVQHGDNNQLVDLEAEGQPAFPYKAVDPDKEYGFVAVAAGDGIKQLFTDLGVDKVVSGGQTMTPPPRTSSRHPRHSSQAGYLCCPTIKISSWPPSRPQTLPTARSMCCRPGPFRRDCPPCWP